MTVDFPSRILAIVTSLTFLLLANSTIEIRLDINFYVDIYVKPTENRRMFMDNM
jgi:hypothetical protein